MENQGYADARMAAFAAEGRKLVQLLQAGVCVHDATLVTNVTGRDAAGMLAGDITCRDCSMAWPNHAAYMATVLEVVA
jgi:hypothetical protein